MVFTAYGGKFYINEAHLQINQASGSWKTDLNLCRRNCLLSSRRMINNHKCDVNREEKEMKMVLFKIADEMTAYIQLLGISRLEYGEK